MWITIFENANVRNNPRTHLINSLGILSLFAEKTPIIPLLFVFLQPDMSNEEYIRRFSPNLFWDANPLELKMDESRGYIIQRVLEYGQMNDWLLINRYYGLDQIVAECKKMRSLNPVCLAFICTISHTKEEEYRCYHFRQSCPTPWNS